MHIVRGNPNINHGNDVLRNCVEKSGKNKASGQLTSDSNDKVYNKVSTAFYQQAHQIMTVVGISCL